MHESELSLSSLSLGLVNEDEFLPIHTDGFSANVLDKYAEVYLDEHKFESIFSPRSFEIEVAPNCDSQELLKMFGIPEEIPSFSLTMNTTVYVQRRRHKKRRINKKWAKRYGYITKLCKCEMKDVKYDEANNTFTSDKIVIDSKGKIYEV